MKFITTQVKNRKEVVPNLKATIVQKFHLLKDSLKVQTEIKTGTQIGNYKVKVQKISGKQHQPNRNN